MRAASSPWIYVAVVLGLLALLPASNLMLAPPGERSWTREALFAVDRVAAWTARALLPLGISLRPDQVVVGREGWLFLGEGNDATRSATRRAPVEADAELGRRLATVASRWESYFARQGVRHFRIVMVPNKDAVYPEFLPDWARPQQPAVVDRVLEAAGQARILDLRPALAAAKSGDHLLYHRTDSHWTFAGMGVGFRAMAEALGSDLPDLRWPDASAYRVSADPSRKGGDLANLLRVSPLLDDVQPMIAALEWPLQTEQIDFHSGAQRWQGGNPPLFVPGAPVLVRAEGALNPIKLLWLRDSFGTKMAPMMAHSFEQTLHWHWQDAWHADGRLADVVQRWQPDIVLLVIVERSLLSPRFAEWPEPPGSD